MKISEIKDSAPAMELRKVKPSGGAPDAAAPVSAEKGVEPGDSGREAKTATEPVATPPLLDFQPTGVRNDFSGKYRRAVLALEGTIYRLEQSQLALLNSAEGADGVIALPENGNLQQTADGLAMLAHIEAVKFKKSY